MSIIRAGSGVIYFVHLPKCLDTAIEGGLNQCFGRRDQFFMNLSRKTPHEPQHCSQSSSQHVDAVTLGRNFSQLIFDAMFTMTRHSARHLRSVYQYQKGIEQEIKPVQNFADWIVALLSRRATASFNLDKHARPIAKILPQGAVAFRQEEGTQTVVNRFAALLGNENGRTKISQHHSREEWRETAGKPARGDDLILTPAELSRSIPWIVPIILGSAIRLTQRQSFWRI